MGDYEDSMTDAPTEDGCEYSAEPSWVETDADPNGPMRCVHYLERKLGKYIHEIPQGSLNCEDLKREGRCPLAR